MYWANFLHIYQPPTQTEEIVRKVAQESYRTLVRVLEMRPEPKLLLILTPFSLNNCTVMGLAMLLRD